MVLVNEPAQEITASHLIGRSPIEGFSQHPAARRGPACHRRASARDLPGCWAEAPRRIDMVVDDCALLSADRRELNALLAHALRMPERWPWALRFTRALADLRAVAFAPT